MSDWKPRIAVVGAGAVGAYYGGRLAQHGHDVHFLLRGDYSAVAERGWTIRSRDGDFFLPPGSTHVYDDARKMPPADLVILSLKATSNDQYEPLVRPLLQDDTAILTLQNGLGNEERLAELFGAQRILGGLAFTCINRIAPGVIHHTEYGFIRIGEFAAISNTPPAQRIAATFNACKVKCEVLPSLKYGRWEKLVWNIPFNGLGAALDLSTERLLADPAGVDFVRGIMAEVVATARAAGANLPDEIIDANIRRTQTMGPYKSSMQIDRQLGRPMEVEAILGEPARIALRLGVTSANLQMLYQMVRLVNLGNQNRLPKPAFTQI